MGNLAYNNVSPIRPDIKVVEPRVADLDDGYTRLATMILEELAGADFTKRQFKVLLAIIRLTYGWNKPRDRIANSQISEIAKLPVKRVSETRVQLIKMNVLAAVGQMIGINKNVSEWSLPQNEGLSPKLRDKKSPKTRDDYPSKQGDTIDIIPKTLNKPTLTLPEEGIALAAQDVLDYYNELTNSRCSATAPFEKALTTVKAKGKCYTADEIQLVIRWMVSVWKHKAKPENICRMTRFDGYLSDALIWDGSTDHNPAACPHAELTKVWNETFPERPIETNEWIPTRPAYRHLERVWNIKTNMGGWREVKHMKTIFTLLRQSSLCSKLEEKPWLSLDWILQPKNWSAAYEQAKQEFKNRQSGAAV